MIVLVFIINKTFRFSFDSRIVFSVMVEGGGGRGDLALKDPGGGELREKVEITLLGIFFSPNPAPDLFVSQKARVIEVLEVYE